MNMDEMRSALLPKGTKPVVQINDNGFYDSTFIEKCLDEMSTILATADLQSPSKLEMLAMHVLMASAEKNS